MGFCIASQHNASHIFAEFALANAQEGDELFFPQELTNPEMEGELAQQGALKGESKEYAFVRQESLSLPFKSSEYIVDINRPQTEKLSDIKNFQKESSLKESPIKEKIFKTLESTKQNLDGQSQKQNNAAKPTLGKKTDLLFQQNIKTGNQRMQPPTKGPGVLKQQPIAAKNLENKLHKELASNALRSENRRKSPEESKQVRPQEKAIPKETEQATLQQKADKNQEREQGRKQKDEEEGFAEDQKKHQHEEPQEEGQGKVKCEKVSSPFAKEFNKYAADASILSQILNMRVTQFDVLVLFIEILKIDIKSREQSRIARMQERELQILHMQKVVENYKGQAKWLMYSSIGSGVLAIVSGLCPIVGYMKGKWIIEKLGSIFSSLREMKKEQFFKGVTKITYAMSEMYKSTGQIYGTFSEGDRTYDQHMSDLYKSDWDESTRTMDDIKDSWKGIENFLYQTLQMYHDAVRQLYNA